jgi:four helix bundle protein
MEKKNQEIKSFEDLEVWQYTRKLQRSITELIKTFPKSEQYRLSDQMIRAARSSPRNIAEGFGRYHFQENIKFCRYARGSLNELLNELITAYEENYIDKSQLQSYREFIETCIRLLNGYISYLNKARTDTTVRDESIPYNPLPTTDNQ